MTLAPMRFTQPSIMMLVVGVASLPMDQHPEARLSELPHGLLLKHQYSSRSRIVMVVVVVIVIITVGAEEVVVIAAVAVVVIDTSSHGEPPPKERFWHSLGNTGICDVQCT